MIRTNLEMDDFDVRTASTATACLALLREGDARALVVDVELIQDCVPRGDDLLRVVNAGTVPVLLLSLDAADRALVRDLPHAAFCSRPDRIEEVSALVRALAHAGARI